MFEPPYPTDRRQETEPGGIWSRWHYHGQQCLTVLASLNQGNDLIGGLTNSTDCPFFQDRDAVYNGILTTVTRQHPVDWRTLNLCGQCCVETSAAKWATQPTP